MLIAAGAFARSYWSLPIANFGEVLITVSLIASVLQFAEAPKAIGSVAK